MTDLLKLVALAGIGGLAGFLNVTAGGGSLLSLPFLIFLGLPPTAANGTNRIAILVQNIFATTRFHRFQVIPKGVTLITAGPAVVGAILGAQIAVDIDQLLFKRLLAVIMVVVMALIFFGPGSREANPSHTPGRRARFWLPVAFLGVGLYGGFIQGGIGFLLIAVLSLAGYDLVRTNALKVLVILCFTPFALLVFVLHGQVDVVKGLVLACGNALGAWLASRMVVEKGQRFIRWIVMLAVLGFAAKLFVD